MRKCEGPECTREQPQAQYCAAHRQQMRRWGYMKPIHIRPVMAGTECKVATCNRPAWAKHFCRMHWDRNHTHGDPNIVLGPWPNHDKLAPASYAVAHKRVRQFYRGPASSYTCVDCGAQAREWAYDGTDPTELISSERTSRGCRYSMYPEFYMPLCIPCHRASDNAFSADELYEYRTWKRNNPGKTLADV